MEMMSADAKSHANGKDPSRHKTFTVAEHKLLDSILGQNPPIVELAIEVLSTDWTYQTRPRNRILNQIINDFKEGGLGVLVISQRPDKTYWVCDGETRRQGLMARGDKHRLVRCLVYQTQGQKQEALLFAWFNSRRSKEPIKLETYYQALHVAGTDGGFGKLIENCGFKLNATGKRRLNGIGMVRIAFDLDDGSALERTLFAIKEAWIDKFKIYGYMVLGIALLYHGCARRSIDEQVRRILNRKTPDEIMDLVAAKYLKAGGKHLRPDDKPELIMRVIAAEINKNPGKAGKIEPKLEPHELHPGI
jgi:hypothetical protein